jgi:hypothetical protein
LYSNYGVNANTRLKAKYLTKLLEEAYKKEQEDSLWEVWKLQFPNMDKETFISFEDYKAKFMDRKHTEISYEEIETEMAKVEKAFAERR